MKTVWKYEIPVDDVVEIVMPEGAEVLSVGVQHGKAMMWALVDPSSSRKEQRRFRFAGTGHLIEDHHTGKFIGTFFMHGGALVFHIFEITTKQSEFERLRDALEAAPAPSEDEQ